MAIAKAKKVLVELTGQHQFTKALMGNVAGADAWLLATLANHHDNLAALQAELAKRAPKPEPRGNRIGCASGCVQGGRDASDLLLASGVSPPTPIEERAKHLARGHLEGLLKLTAGSAPFIGAYSYSPPRS